MIYNNYRGKREPCDDISLESSNVKYYIIRELLQRRFHVFFHKRSYVWTSTHAHSDQLSLASLNKIQDALTSFIII